MVRQKTVNRLINGHTSLDVTMAQRIGASVGTTAEFWLNLQKAVDLYGAVQAGPDLPPIMEQFKQGPRL